MVDREFTDARADRGRYSRPQTDPSVEVSPCASRDPRRLLTRAPGARADVRGRAGPDVGPVRAPCPGRGDPPGARARARAVPVRGAGRARRRTHRRRPRSWSRGLPGHGVGAGPGRAGAGRGLPRHLRPPRHPGGHGRRPGAGWRGRPPRLLVLRDDDPARRRHLRGRPGRGRRGPDRGRPRARRRPGGVRAVPPARATTRRGRPTAATATSTTRPIVAAPRRPLTGTPRSPSSTSTTTTATAPSRSSTSATTSSTCRSTATRTGPTRTSPGTPTRAAAAGAGREAQHAVARRAPTTPLPAALAGRSRRSTAFGPTTLVVSLGVDTFDRPDRRLRPHHGRVRPRRRASSAELGRPTVVLQEGGYDVPTIGENVRTWLAGFDRAASA